MFYKTIILYCLLFMINFRSVFAMFSEHQHGIVDTIPTNNKVIYLTFDACGGKNGLQLDMELIKFLINNKIKSTIFVTSKFLLYKNNREIIKQLYDTGYFDIQNHGKNHKPASVNGKSIYGFKGTRNIEELEDEVLHSANLIFDTIGKMPTWYRSGTAYYDSEAINFINNLGFNIAGFTIAVDGGTTFEKNIIVENIKSAKSGDILLIHLNHPEKNNVKNGVIEGLRWLIENGFEFGFLL